MGLLPELLKQIVTALSGRKKYLPADILLAAIGAVCFTLKKTIISGV
jgi:hypothetical protein